MGHFVAGEEMGHFVAGTICRMGRKWDILSSGTICRPKNVGGTICRWDKMSPNHKIIRLTGNLRRSHPSIRLEHANMLFMNSISVVRRLTLPFSSFLLKLYSSSPFTLCIEQKHLYNIIRDWIAVLL